MNDDLNTIFADCDRCGYEENLCFVPAGGTWLCSSCYIEDPDVVAECKRDIDQIYRDFGLIPE
jgi:hypothetical protein